MIHPAFKKRIDDLKNLEQEQLELFHKLTNNTMRLEYTVRLLEVKNKEVPESVGGGQKSKAVFGIWRQDFETINSGFSRDVDEIVIRSPKLCKLNPNKKYRITVEEVE